MPAPVRSVTTPRCSLGGCSHRRGCFHRSGLVCERVSSNTCTSIGMIETMAAGVTELDPVARIEAEVAAAVGVLNAPRPRHPCTSAAALP